MAYEAKAGGEGDLRVFRFVPRMGTNFPEELRHRLLYNRSIFLFNLKPHDAVAAATVVPLYICFNSSALGNGDFDNLARQLVSHIPNPINTNISRHLLANKIAHYLKSCFHFYGFQLKPSHPCFHRPTLIFVLDIPIHSPNLKKDVQEDEDEDDEDSNDNNYCCCIDDCDKSTSFNNPIINYDNYNKDIDRFASMTKVEYQSLEAEDDEILGMWFAQFMKDIGRQHLANNINQVTFMKVKPTLQVLQSKDFDIKFGEEDDIICSICLDKLSGSPTHQENTILLRCNHVFHTHCLFQWLPNTPYCPYCRSSTLTAIMID